MNTLIAGSFGSLFLFCRKAFSNIYIIIEIEAIPNNTSQNNKKGASKMSKLKTIEILLAAIYTLISAALSIVKFIKQLGKLNVKTEPA